MAVKVTTLLYVINVNMLFSINTAAPVSYRAFKDAIENVGVRWVVRPEIIIAHNLCAVKKGG